MVDAITHEAALGSRPARIAALLGLGVLFGAWRHNAYLSAIPALYLAASFAAWTVDRPLPSQYVAPPTELEEPDGPVVDRSVA